jgi:hypothetical protein
MLVGVPSLRCICPTGFGNGSTGQVLEVLFLIFIPDGTMQVLDANPAHVKALYRRGMAYMAAGDFEEARGDFTMVTLVIQLLWWLSIKFLTTF